RHPVYEGQPAEPDRIRTALYRSRVHARWGHGSHPETAVVKRLDVVIAGVLLAILAVVPHVLRGTYFLDLGVLTFLFISQALAWNLLGGFAGQVSFGY